MPAVDDARGSATPVLIQGISQTFGETRVLKALSLEIAAGETVALLGPSGCGKTTLLRLVAGLARPTGGRIDIGERRVVDADSGVFVPPEGREIGMVFQDYALWPHMSVAKNVAFPLEMRGLGRSEREARVTEALGLVGLDGMGERAPGTLSGGQQQRVALARAIVARPPVILFDEPLSNLDRELRESLVVDIAALLRRLGMTALYVTHDHGEAFAIADRVAILSRGDLLQVDAPEDLVARPGTVDVATFLKLGVILDGRVEEGDLVLGSKRRLRPPQGFLNGDRSGQLFLPRAALTPMAVADGGLAAVARHSAFRGDGYSVQLELEEGALLDLHSPRRVAQGEQVGLSVAWERARWFPHTSL
ncbi:MAG: ABC transporter ATP-binding protein [Rhodospirillum sp.]|nr:ABC transporter ATP-binding protein [Rhodospirillum sp.]MCF8492038.1 ABC transporter ATP-binding protein [Rhodospirillum sp.]MCF8501846.1 ABC transporter ATP-binding protein [Rhodospirillum sp.]